jgi:hypothetical protein
MVILTIRPEAFQSKKRLLTVASHSPSVSILHLNLFKDGFQQCIILVEPLNHLLLAERITLTARRFWRSLGYDFSSKVACLGSPAHFFDVQLYCWERTELNTSQADKRRRARGPKGPLLSSFTTQGGAPHIFRGMVARSRRWGACGEGRCAGQCTGSHSDAGQSKCQLHRYIPDSDGVFTLGVQLGQSIAAFRRQIRKREEDKLIENMVSVVGGRVIQ